MTDDYRERIIKWLSGNYNIETSSTEPLFQELEQTTTEINTYLDTILGYIQGFDGKGNQIDIGFIYGIKNNKGVILIVDSNFNIIQVIEEYNTGTHFGEFICLNIDKTNGNIYGIDYQDSKYRFILLNNFLIKRPLEQYEVKLRNSYFIQFTHSSFVPKYVEKRPSDSFYIITGMTTKPMVATYKIEVGSTNELVEYEYSGSYSGTIDLKTYNIEWSGEEFIENIGCLNYISTGTNIYDITYNELTFNGETLIETSNIFVSESSSTVNQLLSYSGVQITNNDTFINFNRYGDYDSVLVKIDYDNSTTINYFEIEGDITLDYVWTGLKTLKLNNFIYFYGYENTTAPIDNTQANIQLTFGIITNANGIPYIIKEEFDGGQLYDVIAYAGEDILYVSNTYNLYTYHLLGSRSTTLSSVQQIYNILNYNFADYEDINSMIPNSAWLYNNNKIIFARNLYNKVVNGNRTISTVEVPNLMLNEISITPQRLLGTNNGELVNETEAITKNIYEDLFINFYNTLTIQNQNTVDYIINLNGATRLNSSISQIMDYDNCKIGKIKINYVDETNEIKGIEKATKISQFVYQFNFQIFVPKAIESIELLSNDELTSYQTITTTFELNKYYSIKQNVEIEEG